MSKRASARRRKRRQDHASVPASCAQPQSVTTPDPGEKPAKAPRTDRQPQKTSTAASASPVALPALTPVGPQEQVSYRNVPLPSPVALAALRASESSLPPVIRRGDLPAGVPFRFLSLFCAVGLMMTAQWSMVIVSVLSLACLIDLRARQYPGMIGRGVLAAVSSTATWITIRSFDYEAEMKLGEAMLTCVTFAVSLIVVGDLLRRICSLHTHQPRLHVALWAMGTAAQLVAWVVGFVGVCGLSLALLLS